MSHRKEVPLFLEEVAQRAHHVTAATLGLGVPGRAVAGGLWAMVALLVLLDRVFGNAAHNRAADCTEDAVVGLVACEAAGCAACQSTGETTLALLCLIGCSLVIATVAQLFLAILLLAVRLLTILVLLLLLLLLLTVVVAGRAGLRVLLAIALLLLGIALLTVALLGVSLRRVSLVAWLTITLLGIAALAVALVVLVIARHDVKSDEVWMEER